MLKSIGFLLCLLISPIMSLAADEPPVPNPCMSIGIPNNANPANAKEKPKKDKDRDKKVLLSRVFCEVQHALDAYQSTPDVLKHALPPLSTVDFQFTVTTDKGAGLELDFFIFKLNASRTSETINQVDFQYTPPPPPPPPVAHNVGEVKKPQPPTIQQALLDTITAAARSVQQVSQLAPDPNNPLIFKQLTVTLSYGVTWTGSVGLDIPISIVTLSPSVNGSKDNVQQVTLVFAPPSS